jgi:hypothetical protein
MLWSSERYVTLHIWVASAYLKFLPGHCIGQMGSWSFSYWCSRVTVLQTSCSITSVFTETSMYSTLSYIASSVPEITALV